MATNWLLSDDLFFTAAGPATQLVINTKYESRGIFSIDASNKLQATFWIVKDGVQMISGLGLASYLIRDFEGNTIGISESNIAADSNGLFITTPVLATSIQDLTHYTVELNIVADSENRKNILGITLGE